MSIQTYTHEVMDVAEGYITALIPLWTLDDEGNVGHIQGHLKPGDMVTHAWMGGRGAVIGVIENEVVILWAEEPNPSLPFTRRPLRGFNLRTSPVPHPLTEIQPLSLPPGSTIFYLNKDEENDG